MDNFYIENLQYQPLHWSEHLYSVIYPFVVIASDYRPEPLAFNHPDGEKRSQNDARHVRFFYEFLGWQSQHKSVWPGLYQSGES